MHVHPLTLWAYIARAFSRQHTLKVEADCQALPPQEGTLSVGHDLNWLLCCIWGPHMCELSRHASRAELDRKNTL